MCVWLLPGRHSNGQTLYRSTSVTSLLIFVILVERVSCLYHILPVLLLIIILQFLSVFFFIEVIPTL